MRVPKNFSILSGSLEISITNFIQAMLRVVPPFQELKDGGNNHVVDFLILPLNDVYDAMLVEDGRKSGLARVATLYQQLQEENPNIFSVMVNDFLPPSAMLICADASKTATSAGSSPISRMARATLSSGEGSCPQSSLRLRFKWLP